MVKLSLWFTITPIYQVLYLPGDMLKLAITAMLALPICSKSSTEFKELKRAHSTPNTQQMRRLPKSFVTWTCDGLTDRITQEDLLNCFYNEIKEFVPDVIAFQQVKWRARPDDHTQVLPNSEDADNYELLSTTLAPHYQLYLNLSDRQYGGQMLLVHKNCRQPHSVSYSFGADPPLG